MKTVPAQAQQLQVEAFNILALDFPAPTGTKVYSDTGRTSPVTMEGAVLSWGALDSSAAGRAPVSQDISLRLGDPLRTIKGYFDAVAPRNVTARLYQAFGGTNEMVLLVKGPVADPVRWNEADASLDFDIVDPWMVTTRTLSTLVTKEDFADVREEDDGGALPLVMGRCQGVAPIALRFGATTNLARGCSWGDMAFIVSDAQRFPQDTQIDIIVDREVVRGSFHGNLFTVTDRGVKLLGGITTASCEPGSIIDTNLPTANDDTYRGWYVVLTLPSDEQDQRFILGYHNLTRTFRLMSPFTTSLISGNAWPVPRGTPYWVRSMPMMHEAGAPVRHKTENVIYIVNDAPSKKVQAVKVRGQHRILLATVQNMPLYATGDQEGWVQLEPSCYTVNLNDTTSFPILDHAVTTITLLLAPSEIVPWYTGNQLQVTLWGVETDGDGTGQLITNPADAVRWLLLNRMGLTTADLQEDAFQDAREATADLTVAFSLRSTSHVAEVAADLAWQSRCGLVWEAGKARLFHLRNKPSAATPALTLALTHRADGGLGFSWLAPGEVNTEVIATLRQTDDRLERIVLRDPTAEALYGRRSLEVDLWAYQSKRCAKRIAAFLLGRSCRVWRRLQVQGFLTALGVERGDVIVLSGSGWLPSGQRAWVESLRHEPGQAQGGGRVDTLGLSLLLPVAEGCASASAPCEMTCETGTSEFPCSGSDETDCSNACETSCQDACELGCVTSSQGSWCVGSAQTQCGGDETDCWTCESVCQFEESGTTCLPSVNQADCGCSPTETEAEECQAHSESDDHCWVYDESGQHCPECESSQTPCGSCQGGTMTDCHPSDQACWCESEEAGCPDHCEACEVAGCQTSCETTCESSCESDNMTGPCACCDEETPDHMWITVSGLGGEFCGGQGGTFLANLVGGDCAELVQWTYTAGGQSVTVNCHLGEGGDHLWAADYSGTACGCAWQHNFGAANKCTGGSMSPPAAGNCLAGGGGGTISWVPAY